MPKVKLVSISEERLRALDNLERFCRCPVNATFNSIRVWADNIDSALRLIDNLGRKS